MSIDVTIGFSTTTNATRTPSGSAATRGRGWAVRPAGAAVTNRMAHGTPKATRRAARLRGGIITAPYLDIAGTLPSPPNRSDTPMEVPPDASPPGGTSGPQNGSGAGRSGRAPAGKPTNGRILPLSNRRNPRPPSAAATT